MYGDELFEAKKWQEAALYYADSNCKFEDVVLKFTEAEASDAL